MDYLCADDDENVLFIGNTFSSSSVYRNPLDWIKHTTGLSDRTLFKSILGFIYGLVMFLETFKGLFNDYQTQAKYIKFAI